MKRRIVCEYFLSIFELFIGFAGFILISTS